MSAAAQAFRQMRRILDAPARDSALWKHLTPDQRAGVLRSARLPEQWHDRQWESLTNRERTRILNQIQQFSGWAKKLQVPQ